MALLPDLVWKDYNIITRQLCVRGGMLQPGIKDAASEEEIP